MRSLYTFGLFVVALIGSPAAAQEWGSIKGQLVLENGNRPAPKPLNVNKDQQHCLARGPILPEDYIVNPKNKGVRYVVVWIAGEKNGRADYKGELPIHKDLKNIPADKKKVVMD